jgi:predicted dehydrogenase
MYKAVIIGCGSIGAMKPDKFDSPTTKSVLTHAHAIYNNPSIDLLGFIDSLPWKAEAAAKKWDSDLYDDLRQGQPDIVVVATPTETHQEVFHFVKDMLKPRLIIGEKPLGANSDECHWIVNNAGAPVLTHYIRRFEPRHQELAKAFTYLRERRGIYGCRVMYGRGLMHDGCHALDLMNWWFGDILSCVVTNTIRDYEDNVSYGFAARYQYCPQVTFTPVDSKKVGLFEIDIITDIGTYSLIGNGTKLCMRPVVTGDAWGDYPSLGLTTSKNTTQLTSAMTYMYKNVVAHLKGKTDIMCTGNDAMKVWSAYNRIIGGMK